jgi:DDT domain/Williams-Beuren syndrome DDT (WSD), D-TOX E motif
MNEKEIEQMEKLEDFIDEKGGDRSLVANFRCKVFPKMGGERYDANYYSEQGQRFRSMLDVGRFLGLVADNKKARSAAGAKSRANLKRRSGTSSSTSKEVAAQRKKLRRELDRLRKQYSRATKSLDEFVNAEGKETTESPIDDAFLIEADPSIRPSNCSASLLPDIRQFPNLPDYCMADVLQSWDFLCTFSRTLNLQTISLENFVNCLTYEPPKRPTDSEILKDPPVFLGEVHMSLLTLILSDITSDEWWWSILETEQTENAVVEDDAEAEAAAKEEESDLPLINVDFAALLADPEDPLMTTSWLRALQPICKGKDKDSAAMRQTLKSATALVSNKWVLAYLRKATQLGKTSGSSFLRKAVVWLVENVSNAKPELSANPPSKSEVLKIRAKVVEDVLQQMEKLSSATLKVDADDLISDAEDEDSDDESEDEGDNKAKSPDNEENTLTLESDEDRLASYIPKKPTPSLVDFLLPPGKPAAHSELLNPSCWPQLIGAAAARIVHRYKRIRNEVDDQLRKCHELDRLTVKERRAREAISTGRVLSEFVSQNGLDDGPTEEAIHHLCEGGDYLKLTPLQRLALLRVLIEAAYDTVTVFSVVDSNYKQRTNAAKALDNEQRKARKEAKEKIAADEAAAREDLALELKNTFIEEKREEIRKLNENSSALTVNEIEELTEQDILDFDEEYAAEYESLPTPESFKKAEVLERVNRLQEKAAFETESLTIVTLAELIDREKKDIERMEEELTELGGPDALEDYELERRAARRIEKLRRDIKKAREAVEDYPEIRDAAVATLNEAISDGTLKSLRSALRVAKNAKLYGPDEETNGVYAVDVVRDAHLELEKVKNMKRVADAQKDLVSKLKKCFIRTEPLGSDRFRNQFWRFDNSDQSHVWTEVNPVLKGDKNSDLRNEPGHVDVVSDDPNKISIGPADIEIDFPPPNYETKEGFQEFCRREYHGSGVVASLPKKIWGCHVDESSIRALMKGLNNRGIRESQMKKILKETLEDKTAAATSSTALPNGTEEDAKLENGTPNDSKQDAKKDDGDEPDAANDLIKNSGDEAALGSVKKLLSGSELVLFDALEELKSAIGQKVRVRTVLESTRDGQIARYETATITGWKLRQDEVPVDSGETEFEPQMKKVDTPLWRAWTEQCSEEWLEGTDLLESLERYAKWERKDVDYFESDAEFLSYRNGLGKYCGKGADALHAMSPFRFGQYMVKCEAELYQGLKLLALENNWGGKSASRNTWITSMKEYSFDFQTVKDGLFTLEKAIFELTGGYFDGGDDNDDSGPSGQELLDDPVRREDIELESIHDTDSGLWNSRESRKVFLEILRRSQTVGILFLALELVCRNTRVYIVKNGAGGKAGRRTTAAVSGEGGVPGYEQYVPLPQRTTRRMNAWQQEQSTHDASFWSEPVSASGGGRRGRRAPVSYAEPDMSFLDDLE